MINSMEKYNLEFVEQPVALNNLKSMASLRKRVRVPIAANQSSWTLSEVMNVIRTQAADIILTDPHQSGGLLNFRKAVAVAETANIPVVKHSFGELGIATFASMHVIASSRNFPYANQIYIPFLSDYIVQGGMPSFNKGCLELPQGTGIGVKLDEEKVKKYAELYRKEGEFSPFAFSLARKNR